MDVKPKLSRRFCCNVTCHFTSIIRSHATVKILNYLSNQQLETTNYILLSKFIAYIHSILSFLNYTVKILQIVPLIYLLSVSNSDNFALVGNGFCIDDITPTIKTAFFS